MPEPTAYTRRQFLNRSLALISTLGTVPAFLSRSSMLMADSLTLTSHRPGDDRVLVVVQLSGGNDGLNTVAPFGFDAYQRARPQLRVREDQALVLDATNGIGLHPSMRPIYEMVEANRCAIVQGVGYPNPNRSHFASMDIWHAGVALDEPGKSPVPHGTGWIGRALDNCKQCNDEPLACVAIGSEAPPATHGKKVQPIAFERSEMFRWAMGEQDKKLDATYQQLQEAPAPDDGDAASFVFRTAMDAQVASAKVRDAVSRRSETQMPRNDLGRQLASVANMIRAELPTRVYYVAMGGFDTHAGQLGRHPNLLRDFSEAIAGFYAELDATGHSNRVVTMAFSEFGRRVTQNASTGTDHGAAGPMFVFGDHLAAPGLIGAHPSLDALDANGDIAFHTDFRSVYADVLSNWMKLDAKAALGRTYKPVSVIKA